jgi:hypothetical protein
MTVGVVVDADVAEQLDRESAERLDKRIRLLVATIHDQIAKLHELVAAGIFTTPSSCQSQSTRW